MFLCIRHADQRVGQRNKQVLKVLLLCYKTLGLLASAGVGRKRQMEKLKMGHIFSAFLYLILFLELEVYLEF